MADNITLNRDYRSTSFSSFSNNINDEKNFFLSEFKKNKGHTTKIYNVIKNRDDPFNNLFKDLYFRKCAYCGVNVRVIDNSRFEIDHVIPKAKENKDPLYTSDYIHGISNLVNSCQMCNRSKSSFYITQNFIETLHPDYNKLPDIFYRDKDYSIKINPSFESNSIIKAFYYKLKLGNEVRRLNHILMEMIEFCEIHKDLPKEIYELILKVEQKRKYNF